MFLSNSRKVELATLCPAHFCLEVSCVEERYNVHGDLLVMTRSFAQRRLKKSSRRDTLVAGLPTEAFDAEARNLGLSGSAGEQPQYMNFAGIDVVSIRLVVACAELGSLSAAALHANISLSCASHRLTTVESRFGARFFMRDHANAVLDALRRMRDQLAALECAVEIGGPNVIKASPVSNG